MAKTKPLLWAKVGAKGRGGRGTERRSELLLKEQGGKVKGEDKEAGGEFITRRAAPVALMFPAAQRYPFNRFFFFFF